MYLATDNGGKAVKCDSFYDFVLCHLATRVKNLPASSTVKAAASGWVSDLIGYSEDELEVLDSMAKQGLLIMHNPNNYVPYCSLTEKGKSEAKKLLLIYKL